MLKIAEPILMSFSAELDETLHTIISYNLYKHKIKR